MNNLLDFIEYALIEKCGAHIFGIFGNLALAVNIFVANIHPDSLAVVSGMVQ